jgi:hypothetical protein
VDLYLRWEANPPYPGFIDCFANGVGLEDARILAAAQRPAALAQFSEPSGPPAWKTIPSWSLIGTLDHVIPRALQEEMSSRAGADITRVRAGHLTPITRPADVTKSSCPRSTRRRNPADPGRHRRGETLVVATEDACRRLVETFLPEPTLLSSALYRYTRASV